MSRVALTSGSYTAHNLIANAQRCVNLYGEKNPPDSPVPITWYPRPGLTTRATIGNGPMRGVYRATDGLLYAVSGSGVYAVANDWTSTLLGSLTTSGGIVSMQDNGTTLVVVDGSPAGLTVDMATQVASAISSSAWYGADRADYMNTFLLFNRPNTRQFYISDSNSFTFDSLYIASKTSYPDNLQTLITASQNIWLLGTDTTEIWTTTGQADFPFGEVPSLLINHGCAAKYSVARAGSAIYWLSKDLTGRNVVMTGLGYEAQRISTHAIENTLSGYQTVDDAVGYCIQKMGHQWYVLSFPTANATWVYDVSTGLWQEWTYTDNNGVENRFRGQVGCSAYGYEIVGDWQNGNLYSLDLDAYTDNGQVIVYRRGFPHMTSDGNRVFYTQLIADMAAGQAGGTVAADEPQVFLRYSDTRGFTWGNPIAQGFGAGGEYITSVQFQRLGMARDRVFELFWSAPYPTALNGAWINTKVAKS